MRVVRGPAWQFGEQDGGFGKVGEVTAVSPRKQVAKVRWEGEEENTYRIGRDGCHDLAAAPAEPDVTNAASICVRAVWAHQSGAEKAAESLYREALSLDPSHGQALIRCGLLLSKQGRHAEAEPLLERAATLPSDEALHGRRALAALRAKGNWSKAKKRLVHARIFSRSNKTEDPLVSSDPVTVETCVVGASVGRGPDWSWGEQGGGRRATGVITKMLKKHSVAEVKWDAGSINKYRIGRDAKHDLAFTVEWQQMSDSSSNPNDAAGTPNAGEVAAAGAQARLEPPVN